MPDNDNNNHTLPASTPIDALHGTAPYSIGPVSARWLKEAGIHTLEDLTALGSIEAYRRIKAMQPRASLNLLWGLEALVQGIPIQAIDADYKRHLKAALAAAESRADE